MSEWASVLGFDGLVDSGSMAFGRIERSRRFAIADRTNCVARGLGEGTIASVAGSGKARDDIQAVYSMKTSMLVKCEKCGYENFPQHRFCGMCAAELRIPTAAGAQPAPAPKRVAAPPLPPPKRSVPTSVSGPSFLGLANEPVETRSVSYLLEDEPEPSHRARYLWLIVLVAAIAAGWYWRQDLGSLAGKLSSSVAGAKAQPNAPAGSASETTPANSAGEQVAKPGADDQAAAAPAQVPVAPAPASPSTGNAAQSSQPDQPQATNPPPLSESAPSAAKPDARPLAVSRPATASATTGDDLEAEGEKYLYGNGVPENCGHARKSLLAAAQHSNAKAQNVLGTMYATGHCATRDLPTAYRWFGRSLRKDPNNTRIEEDLKVLWNQMTPEEQRVALRNER